MSKDIEALIQQKRGMGLKILGTPSDKDPNWWNGRLLMWEAPEAGATYGLGIDPAEGVRQDRSVCEVVKKPTINSPALQVAEFACDFLDPIDFASVVATIGRLYVDSDGNEAFATVEINAPCGDVLQNDLRSRLDYTNLYVTKAYDRINNIYTNKYGWNTNKANRPKILARGSHAFMQGDLVVNSPFLVDEMGDFVRDGFVAKAQAKRGKHDDRVIALLIAYYGLMDDDWQGGDDIDAERRLRRSANLVQDRLIETSGAPGQRPDYQNQAITYKQMQERLNDQFDY